MPARVIGRRLADTGGEPSSSRAARGLFAALLVAGFGGPPTEGWAQSFDNRPTLSRGAPASASPTAGTPSACPSWLNEPYIAEALSREEPHLRSELNNQLAMAGLMSTRGLVDRGVLFDKLRSSLASVVMGATQRNSRSPRKMEEIGERDNVVRAMSYETLAVCMPRIASLLTEVEGQVAAADKAEAERQAQARSPAGRIATVYAGYAAIRACARARAGRALVYVTSEDVEDAKQKAKAVEQRLARENPTLDLDALWAEATKPAPQPGGLLGFGFGLDDAGRYDLADGEFTAQGKAYCQGARRRIEGAYAALFADEAKPKKDF